MSSCEPLLSSLQPSNHFPILTLTPLVSSSELSHSFPWGFWYSFLSATFHLSQQVFLSLNLREKRLRFGDFAPTNLLYCWVCACSVMSNCLRPCGLWPTRLLCPWDSPGKDTGVGCHLLLRGILPTQGSNLLHWQVSSLPLSHLGSQPSLLLDKFIFFLLGYWICLSRSIQGETGFINPLKKLYHLPLGQYLLRIFITEKSTWRLLPEDSTLWHNHNYGIIYRFLSIGAQLYFSKFLDNFDELLCRKVLSDKKRQMIIVLHIVFNSQDLKNTKKYGNFHFVHYVSP